MPVENLFETSHVLLFLEGVVMSILSSSSSLCLCMCNCMLHCCKSFFWGGRDKVCPLEMVSNLFDLFKLRMAAV